MKIYLVGGAIRDFLLGHTTNDNDYVVTGSTEQDMLDRGFVRVGADFPVFLHPETKDEYALARRERKVRPGYHGFETEFDPGVTIEEDLSRRDLTINAMAVAVDDWMDYKMNLDYQLLIDPFNGYTDLDNNRLHIVSDAFAEDPVRILRTAKFQARYGFSQSRETTVAIMKMVKAGEVDALVPERVWTETVKAIVEKRIPLDYFFFLEFHDCRKQWFKQLNLTDQLMYNFDHVEFMDAKQRMAMLTSGFKNSDQVGAFFDKLKAPTDFRSLAVATHKLASLARQDLDADTIIDTLQQVGAFSNDASDAAQALHVAVAFDADYVPTTFHANVELMQSVLPVLAHVSFQDLTHEQQFSLKGKEIGDALRDIRIDMVQNAL